MSWANLEDAFWRSNRYLPNAEMNKTAQVFQTYRPNIEQPSIWVRATMAIAQMDTRGKATTRLSAIIGEIPGLIRKMELNEEDDSASITVRYPR